MIFFQWLHFTSLYFSTYKWASLMGDRTEKFPADSEAFEIFIKV